MSTRPGFVVWFTGLSGSGKSTLATLLSAELAHRGVHVEILDGDEVRRHLSKGLGFSREDRDTNVRRIGFVAKLLARAGACAMTATISPYRDVRDELRRDIGRFVEVYCRCSIDVLTARDPKGLYVKALAGEIAHFSGVTDPYEEPLAPDVVVDTAAETKEESLGKIVAAIEGLGYLDRGEHAVRLPAPHGGALIQAPLVVVPDGARSIAVSAADAAWLELTASGALSPVTGPLGEKDLRRVRKEHRLESGRAFPLPFSLSCPFDATEGETLAIEGGDLALVVHETFRAGAEQYVAGSVAVSTRGAARAERDPRRVREALADRGGGAAGRVVRGPLGHSDVGALVQAAGDASPIVLLTACPSGAAVAAPVAARAGTERVLVADLPALPLLAEAEQALLDVILLKNYGVERALLAPGSAALLSSFTRAELGVDVVAGSD